MKSTLNEHFVANTLKGSALAEVYPSCVDAGISKRFQRVIDVDWFINISTPQTGKLNCSQNNKQNEISIWAPDGYRFYAQQQHRVS